MNKQTISTTERNQLDTLQLTRSDIKTNKLDISNRLQQFKLDLESAVKDLQEYRHDRYDVDGEYHQFSAQYVKDLNEEVSLEETLALVETALGYLEEVKK